MNERTQPTGGAIRVGDFDLDPRSGELSGSSGRQLLSAQPLHVLLALTERPGQVVTRDELRARLWPADTYVDFEHGLNAVVKRLRDALGDSADTPRYIETVPRRGYRLVAVVEPAETPAAAPPSDIPLPAAEAAAVAQPSLPPDRPQPRFFRQRVPLIAAGLLTAGAVAAFVYGSRRPEAEATHDAPPAAVAAAATRLTFGPGLHTDAAWSPDGRRIAFASDRYGNFDLFTQSLDGGDPVRLTSSPANDTQPAWSPDGLRLVFRSDEDAGGIFTVSLEGGAIRRIASLGFQPAWMPDGRDIAFAGGEMQAIYLVKADGGEAPRAVLKEALVNGSWSSFAVHPDGRLGVFGIHPEQRLGFYLSDRQHRQLHSVTTGTILPEEWRQTFGRVVWSRAGDAVLIDGVASGVPALWRAQVNPVTARWGRPVRLSTGLAGAERPAISPDGTRLAFTSAQSTIRAWVFPFDADRGTPPGEGHPVTDEDASISNLYVSADGKAVYYMEDRAGRAGALGVGTALDTGESKVLNRGASGGFVPAPSGRGGSYMLQRAPGGAASTDLEYALAWRDANGRERLLSPWTRGAMLPTDVRRDEQAVLGTLMRTAFTGPGPLVEWPLGPTVSAAPSRVLLESRERLFYQGRYSPDGRWVAFVTLELGGDGTLELGLVPADGRSNAAWTRLAADHPWPDKPRWSPDGRTIYFLSRAASGYFHLWGVRFDPDRGGAIGAPFRIAQFDSPRWHIDPNNSSCELGVAKARLVLPMRSVRGSIWLLPTPKT